MKSRRRIMIVADAEKSLTHEFKGVQEIVSGNLNLLMFRIAGSDLVIQGIPCRLAEDPETGVQRQIMEKHVVKIVDAMRAGTPFPESVALNLVGDWVQEGDTLLADQKIGEDGKPVAWIEILDGQHRMEALKRLQVAGEKDVVEKYSFSAVAVVNGSADVRREVFLSQTRRRALDATHVANLSAKHGQFKQTLAADAYALAEALNMRDDSPLKGKIDFSEQVGRRSSYVGRYGIFHYSAMRTFMVMIVGRTVSDNTLYGVDQADRINIAIDFLRAIESSFPNFLQKKHYLSTETGINTLLCILRNPGHFHMELAKLSKPDQKQVEYYTYDNFLEVLTRGTKFVWYRSGSKIHASKTPAHTAERFNAWLNK